MPTERRLDILYARLYYCGRSDPKEWRKLLDESVTCYDEAFSYLEMDIFATLSEKTRVTAIMLAINGTSMYNTMPHASGNENLIFAGEQKKLLGKVTRILDDPFYRELIPAKSLQKAKIYLDRDVSDYSLKGIDPNLSIARTLFFVFGGMKIKNPGC